jgi:hypothetical protein
MIRPNQKAPELYTDKLSLRVTLMNLPGATDRSSFWEVEFKVYFVAEQEFERTIREVKKAGAANDLRPEHFASKVLLAEGKFSQKKLANFSDRVFLRQGIVFRDKVPPGQQTSFSSILSFYSVRIFDAKLKKDVYASDVFVVPPFEPDTNDRNILLPRTDLFLNFFVADNGSVYRSNTRKASESTEWKPD